MTTALILILAAGLGAALWWIFRDLKNGATSRPSTLEPVPYKVEPVQPAPVSTIPVQAPTVDKRPDLVVADAPHVPQPVYYDFDKLFAPYKHRIEVLGEDKKVVLDQYRAMLDALPKPPGSEGGGGEVPPVNLNRN